MQEAQQQFFQAIQKAIDTDTFVRITLSKPYKKSGDLKKIRVKLAMIQKTQQLSFIYSHATKDITKNYEINEGLTTIQSLLASTFQIASLFSTEADYGLQINKKGSASFHRRPPTFNAIPQRVHDKAKPDLLKTPGYLVELGVLDPNGHAKKGKGDKYKQINKFVEIMAGLLVFIAFN